MMLSKCSTLFVAAIVVSAGQLLASEGGLLECKVKHQTIIRSEDGVPKVYSNYKNGFKIGDKLEFEYSLSGATNVFVKLVDRVRNHLITNSISLLPNYGSLEIEQGPDGPTSYYYETETTSIYISEDRIIINPPAESLKFVRYYKNDYHGLFIKKELTDLGVRVVTLDCRTIKDGFQEIFDSFD